MATDLAGVITAADAAVFRAINSGCSSRLLDPLAILITMMGLGVVQSGACLFLVLSGFIWDRVTLRKAGYAGLVAFAISGVGVQIAKLLWKRPRPLLALFDVRFPDGPLFTQSFPSGHTATAFAVMVAVSICLPRFRYPLLALAVLTGLSRVYLGVHYPLDVVYGAGLGTLLGIVSSRLILNRKPRKPSSVASAEPATQ